MKLKIFFILLLPFILGCEKILIGPEPENTPVANFDALWTTIDEKYGLFPVSDLNWDSLYNVYRGEINESTTDGQLWDICCDLLSHLKNGHVTLVNDKFTRYYSADSPHPDVYSGVNISMIKSNYLIDPTVTGEGFITYGRIKNTGLGYVNISSFYFAASGRDWIRDLENVVKDLLECEGIIIDIRNNGGGYVRNDEYAAGLFLDREVIYYYSRQKTGPGHDDFGEAIAKYVYPRRDTLKFIKKNAVLTNRATASGGEAFALALGNLPYSVQIGDSTLGAIGEVSHVAQLPNGWVLYYPCTLSLYPDGTSPEGIGVIPDILINNTPEDVQSGRDIVIERAIEYLNNN
jgi:hypothetical protein